MGGNRGSEDRRYSCVHCGGTYAAYPPDDRHSVATISEDDFSDYQTIVYTCENCGDENTLHWGAPDKLNRREDRD